jgi:hypothetical protein
VERAVVDLLAKPVDAPGDRLNHPILVIFCYLRLERREIEFRL